MDGRANKKERERLLVEYFLRLRGEESLLSALQGCELPDFLMKENDRIIGLEVREIFRDPEPGQCPRQAVEAERRRVAEQAAKLWKEKGNPNIEVRLHFSPHYHIRKESVPELAQRLVDLVERHLPTPGLSMYVDSNTLPHGEFPDKAKRIAASREKCGGVWLLLVVDAWRVSSLLEVPDRTKEEIYRSPFDRTFLFELQDRCITELKTKR